MSSQTTVGNDSIINAINLWQLNRLGYINYGPASLNTLPNKFHEKQQALKTGAYIRESLLGIPHDHTSVHRIYEEKNWNGLQLGDYDLMLPSLRLASRFLDDPVILTFFKGMLQTPRPRLNDPKFETTCGEELYSFDKSGLDTGGIDETWKTMDHLSHCVKLEFSPAAGNAYAHTAPSKKSGLQSLAINGWSAKIALNIGFLQVLRDHSIATRVSRTWNPGTETDSAVISTYFLLAITLVHETCHATWVASVPNARTDFELGLTKHEYPLEPFWRDHRLAELGSELENQIISGSCHPTGLPLCIAMPYGMNIQRWPGFANQGGPAVEPWQRGSPMKWGVEWSTAYPVEMEYILSLFDNDIWERVERFGVRVLRPERKMGVRLRMKPQQRKGFPPESPTVHMPQTPDSQKSTLSDEGNDGVVRPGKHRLPRAP